MSKTTVSRKILRVLHVGVANRGVWPLDKCTAATGFQPAALCDVDPEALATARDKTGLPEGVCYADVDRALEHPGLDCVIVCAPTAWHVPLCAKSIQAGLPVLVEKGMAPDWASAQLLVRTAAERKAVVCVAQNYRYSAMERTIHRALHDSDHPAHPGRVHLLIYTQNRVRPIPRTLTYPFASVWDMSCHHFDNLLFWLGPISQMTAFSWAAPWSAYPHHNNTAAHIVFERQTHCHYIHTHDAARANLEIQVHGERGALVSDGRTLTFSERPLEQFGERPSREVPLEPSEGESDLLRDFHRYITEGVEPGISARNNLETMAACEMMVRSITAGQPFRRSQLDG